MPFAWCLAIVVCGHRRLRILLAGPGGRRIRAAVDRTARAGAGRRAPIGGSARAASRRPEAGSCQPIAANSVADQQPRRALDAVARQRCSHRERGVYVGAVGHDGEIVAGATQRRLADRQRRRRGLECLLDARLAVERDVFVVQHRIRICDRRRHRGTRVRRGRAARARGNKSVVRRDVVRLVTPGTLTEDSLLDARTNNYLLAIARARGSSAGDRIGLAWIDISTSEFIVTECSTGELAATLARINPNEAVVTDAPYGT